MANSPIVIADSRTAFQIEFAVAEDGPTFTVSPAGPGAHCATVQCRVELSM